MKVMLRTYRATDYKKLVLLMERFQDHLVKMDPLQRLRRAKNYGKKYTDDLLRKIKKGKGVLYCAVTKNELAGIIAGVKEKQTPINRLECIPTKAARILELFVEEKFRGHGVGSLLMKKMESHFKKEGCDVMRVEVFVPNKNAHAFYNRYGYTERMIDLMKYL